MLPLCFLSQSYHYRSEFLATPNPPPILMYSMCLVAAARHEVPQMTFDSIRYMVNSIVKEEDVLSTASFTRFNDFLTERLLAQKGSVRVKPGSDRFRPIVHPLNLDPDLRFGSGNSLNLGLNLGPVQAGSGSNRGSEPDRGITTPSSSPPPAQPQFVDTGAYNLKRPRAPIVADLD